MNSNFQYFEVKKNKNDDRIIKGLILENGIKIILISDEKIMKSCCTVGVGIGSLHDTHEGIAHFLEHLLFMGSEKFQNQNDYHSYVKNSGGYDNAFTSDEETCYYLVLESKYFKKGIEMLSWFFRSPLLQECHINSERNIVNSEHEKNILSDLWIEDHLSKNFISDENKYRRFSTGNNESLKDVKQSDAKEFYDKYYTTDNLFVCIIDSKNIEHMIENYVPYFKEIIKTEKQKEPLEQINFLDNNLIIYKPISNFSIVDTRIILEIDKHDKQQSSLFKFILFLLFTKFTNSPSYHLLENNYVNDIGTEVTFLYEKYGILVFELFFDKDENTIENVKKSLDIIYTYLNILENISLKEFNVIYEHFINVVKMTSYFEKNKDVSDITISVVMNMISSNNENELSDSIIKNEDIVPYSEELYKIYKNIIVNRIIKIISTINFYNYEDNDFSISKWYNARYKLDNIDKFYVYNSSDFYDKQEFYKQQFNFKELINEEYNDSDILLKIFREADKIESNKIPRLVYENESIKRKIYIVEGNNYDTPLSGVCIMRLLECDNNKYTALFSLYKMMLSKMIQYYLETQSYKLSNFSVSGSSNGILYNFSCINNIEDFVENIIEIASYKNFVKHKKFEEYFYSTIGLFLQNLENEKHNTPFSICQKYLEVSVNKEMTEKEFSDFITELNIDVFKRDLKNVLSYYEEKILIYVNTVFKNDKLISNINDIIYTDRDLIIEKTDINDKISFNKEDYIIPKDFFTPDEINNCLLESYIIREIELFYKDGIISKSSLVSIITNEMICDFLVGLLTDKLFDKLRTIEKLGYIVRVSCSLSRKINKLLFQLNYIVQSTFSIERVESSINEFNLNLKENSDFEENFNTLKENKLIMLRKDDETFNQEMNNLIGNFMLDAQNYNMKDIFIKICENISFEHIKYILQKLHSTKKIKIIIDVNQ